MARIAVTEAESAILAALWHHGPLSFASLTDRLFSGDCEALIRHLSET